MGRDISKQKHCINMKVEEIKTLQRTKAFDKN